MKSMNFDKKKFFLWILYIGYLSLIVFLFFHHENWRDEAQAYLLCRDMNLKEILFNAHYEGHPIAYYVFLYPLVNLGFGPKSVNYLSIFFMACAMYLVLFRSKLNDIQKMCLLFSYPVIYEYSVVGRSYAFLFFLLVLFGFYYPKRKEMPILFSILLGVLLNAHLFMTGLVGIVSLSFYGSEWFHRKENDPNTNRRIFIGFCIFFLMGLLFVLQFYPVLFHNDGMSLNHQFNFVHFIMLIFMNLFLNHCNIVILGFILSMIASLVLFFQLSKSQKKRLLLYFLYCVFVSFIMEVIWGVPSLYHVALTYVVFFSCLLSMGEEISHNKVITACLVVISCLSLGACWTAITYDLKHPYSNAKEVATYMNQNLDSNKLVVCFYDYLCSSLAPYSDFTYYSFTEEKPITYVVWNQEREERSFDKLVRAFQKEKNFYFIYRNEENETKLNIESLEERFPMKKIYESPESSFANEDFIIYEVGDDV